MNCMLVGCYDRYIVSQPIGLSLQLIGLFMIHAMREDYGSELNVHVSLHAGD